MGERVHDRVPICMRVQFRNASSFLVAYTVNLSRGGVFLETEEVLPVGAEIALQLEVPQAGPVTLNGHVTWRRDHPDVDGPRGIGVEFDHIVDPLGDLIDRLVAQFGGITVLLVCKSSRDRVTISRQLRSIIATAEVVGASDAKVAESLLDDEIDLILIDGDTDQPSVLHLLEAAQSLFNPVPSIVMSSEEDLRSKARHSGASEVIANPPPFGELHTAVMRALGRPSAVATKP
jgi:uncharacterized protein (TIGR02266 family)